jgi:hypothetical protein
MTYELLGDDSSFDNLVDFYVELSNFIKKLNSNMLSQYPQSVAEGHAVEYLVEALCYKPEGRGIESR